MKTTKQAAITSKTRSTLPQERRKADRAYRDTPAKWAAAQYARLINYLYPA